MNLMQELPARLTISRSTQTSAHPTAPCSCTFIQLKPALLRPFSPTNHPGRHMSNYASLNSLTWRATRLDIGCEVWLEHDLVYTLPSWFVHPFRWWKSLRLQIQWHWWEVLKQPNEKERYLIVCELKVWMRTSQVKSTKMLTCWPGHILGPALKGRKIKGWGVRYFWSRSSRNLSGSNSRAREYQMWSASSIKRVCTIRTP